MKKLAIALAASVLVALVGWLLLGLPTVQDRLVALGADRRLAIKSSVFALSPDALRVVICGTSPPPPSDTRAKSCTLVMAGNRAFLVDAGPGSANKLSLWRFPMRRLSGILLTHFHSDHIGDLGEYRMQSWATGRTQPLPLYGPTGVVDVATGVNQTYSFDDRVRATEHHLPLAAAALWPRDFGLATETQRIRHAADSVIFDDGQLKITAFQVMHEPVYPAVGYRFDYKGRSVVISGDTAASPNLVRVSRHADVLIHEGQSRAAQAILVAALTRAGDTNTARVMSEVGNYHAQPVEAAQEANQADVGLLVFNHMGPIPPDNLVTRRLFARGLATVRAPSRWLLSDDGLMLTLPAGSKAIERGSVN